MSLPEEQRCTACGVNYPRPIELHHDSSECVANQAAEKPYCWVIESESGEQEFVDSDPDLCNSKRVSKPLYDRPSFAPSAIRPTEHCNQCGAPVEVTPRPGGGVFKHCVHLPHETAAPAAVLVPSDERLRALVNDEVRDHRPPSNRLGEIPPQEIFRQQEFTFYAVKAILRKLAAAPQSAVPEATPTPDAELVKSYEAMFPLLWQLNDNLRVTPDQGVEYTGSTNDVDDFRALLHKHDHRFDKGLRSGELLGIAYEESKNNAKGAGMHIEVNGERRFIGAAKDAALSGDNSPVHLTYETVIQIAGYAAERIVSVTYRTQRKGDEQRSGILSPGRSVAIEEGMRFYVADTSNA